MVDLALAHELFGFRLTSKTLGIAMSHFQKTKSQYFQLNY